MRRSGFEYVHWRGLAPSSLREERVPFHSHPFRNGWIRICVAAHRTVEQVRLVAIVGTTAQLDVVDRGLATHRERLQVMELEEATGVAPPLARSQERAALPIAIRDRPADGGRDVARILRLASALLRPRGGPEPLLLEVGHEQGERAIEHLAEIPAWHRVPQQVLRAPKAVVGLRAGGEADL